MAFSVYRMAESQEVNTNTMRFQLPVCHLLPTDRVISTRNEFFISGPRCVAPLRLPEMIEVRINSDSDTCFQIQFFRFPLPPTILYYISNMEPPCLPTSTPTPFTNWICNIGF